MEGESSCSVISVTEQRPLWTVSGCANAKECRSGMVGKRRRRRAVLRSGLYFADEATEIIGAWSVWMKEGSLDSEFLF